ncbi:hypothetical protein DY000_02031020 [Brassica cretica]|uniref:Exostosin GT47 domain-containing protein n=1 Tax=Brassica cretica TaxID=69181 RepID=A0ABQ7DMY9_BRACR|nr:hypothetical protein DY000_02031020 [Brassica cretica]
MNSSEFPEEFPRNIPTEFRGNINPSVYSEEIPRRNVFLTKFRGNSDEQVIDRCVFGHIPIDRCVYKKTFEILKPKTVVPRNFLGIFRGISDEESPRNIPRKFISSEFRRKFPRDFRGKMNFRGVISEDFFRRYVVGIALFRRHTDDFFPQYAAVFL